MKIIVILVSIVLFWSGVFYFVSCSDQPEKRAVKVAELALKASVDNAKSVRVKFIIKFPAAHTFCDFSCEKVIQISFVWDFLHSPTGKCLEIQSPSNIIMTSEVI